MSLFNLTLSFFILLAFTAAAQNLPTNLPLPSSTPAAVASPAIPAPQVSAAPAAAAKPGPTAAALVPAPGTAVTPPTPPPTSAIPAALPSAEKKFGSPTDLLSGIIEDYTYVPTNKRDPFAPYEAIDATGPVIGPLFPLQKFDIDQLKLVGVIWDVKSPKAMLIDPQGTGYVVRVNERIGRNSGYIARIRESEIVVVEKYKGNDGITSYVTKLLKLSN